jgi:OPA family glycerol-3-phosphate transporter-like MFS transporter
MTLLRRIFAPAPAIPRLPDSEIPSKYQHYRWQILESTFIGYAVFYLVRNNLPVVAKEMSAELHYSYEMLGNILAATALSYGLGKFVMGILSDRSNPRVFMAAGLALTAIINVIFGASSNYMVQIFLWTLNGFVQGMGWPPCGRSLAHWFSIKERGTYFAIWNIAHNVGGGLVGIVAAESAVHFGWRSAFYIPAAIAAVGAIYLFVRLRDTPQSVGLPPIEEFKSGDYRDAEVDEDVERERTTYELLFKDVLLNPILWLFAAANFFVYVVRYGLLDWGPTYLKAAKDASLSDGGWLTLIYEFAGIFSTLLMGWLSDRLGGRRGMISLLCLLPISISLTGIYLTPPGYLWLDFFFFSIIGFFIYPPVMLLGVAGLDFTSKKAVGTAAGFIGLLGYAGRFFESKILGMLADGPGWNAVLLFLGGSLLGAILLLLFTWNLKPKK